MSGRIFARVPKPVSDTRRAPDPVQKRSPWMRESFKARPGQPLPYYVALSSPGPAGVQAKPTAGEPERLPEERPDHTTAPAAFAPPRGDRPAPPDTNPPPSPRGGNLLGSRVLQRQAETEPAQDKEVEAEAAPLQARLTVGAPDDPYEREADRVADSVMRMPEPVEQRQGETEQAGNEKAVPEAVSVQAKLLARSITPWVQRRVDTIHPADTTTPDEINHEQETTLQAKPISERPGLGPVVQRQVAAEVAGETNGTSEGESSFPDLLNLGIGTVSNKTTSVFQGNASSGKSGALRPVLIRPGQWGGDTPIVGPGDESLNDIDFVFPTPKAPINGATDGAFKIGSNDATITADPKNPNNAKIDDFNSYLPHDKAKGLVGYPKKVEQPNRLPAPVQRQVEDREENKETVQTKSHTPRVSSDLDGLLNRTRGSGRSLSESARRFFEPRFGQDFSGVRIHADGQAADAAKTIQAQAFTHKQDIYFGSGHYQPDTGQGKTLLAHELTHVVQQNKPYCNMLSNNCNQLLSRAVVEQFGQATSRGTRYLISDLTSPVVVGSQPLYRVGQHGAEVGRVGAIETYRWQVYDRTTGKRISQMVTATPELKIPATTVGSYQVTVTVLINGKAFTTLSIDQDVVAEDEFLTKALVRGSARSVETYRELVNDFKDYIINVANATGQYGITPRFLASVLFVEVSNRPKAGRETELEDVRSYLNTQQRGGLLYPLQKVDRSVGVGQIRLSTAAMVLGYTPWVDQTPGNRAQGREQTETSFEALEPGKKFAILELLRWPKSNIRVAGELLNRLKNRPNRYPDLSRVDFVASQRSASVVASEYNLGPSNTAAKDARPSNYGNWVWDRMIKDALLIKYFPNK